MIDYSISYSSLYRILTSHKNYAEEVNSLANFLCECALQERWPGTRLLSVGCGIGTHEKLLDGLRFWEIDAVDTSQAMIDVASSGFSSDSLRFYALPVAEIEKSNYSVALSLFNVVNCLSNTNELERFFSAISQRLLVGGGFFFEAWNGVACLTEPPQVVRRVYSGDGQERYYLERVATPTLEGARLRIRYEIDGHVSGSAVSVVSEHHLTLFTPCEIRRALNQAGFGCAQIMSALPELAVANESKTRMLSFFARKV